MRGEGGGRMKESISRRWSTTRLLFSFLFSSIFFPQGYIRSCDGTFSKIPKTMALIVLNSR